MLHTYDRFIQSLQGVKDLLMVPENKPLRGLFKDMLTRILEVEGPPPTPVKDETYRKALILNMGKRRRALVIAETWVKGPWRCLLLYTPSIALERAIHKGKVTDRTRPDGSLIVSIQAITPSRTQKFKRKIVAACRYFGLEAVHGHTAVISVFNQSRAFMAWRDVPEGEWSDNLRGDIDNYQKNQLDGLVEAGVLPDDRWVMFGLATKANYWDEKAPTMDSLLHDIAVEQLEKGVDPEEVSAKIGITKKLAFELSKKFHARRVVSTPPSSTATAKLVKQEATRTSRATKRETVEKALLSGMSTTAVKDETGASSDLITKVRKELKASGRLKKSVHQGRPKGKTAVRTDTKTAAVKDLLARKKAPSDAEITELTGASLRTIRRVRASMSTKKKS